MQQVKALDQPWWQAVVWLRHFLNLTKAASNTKNLTVILVAVWFSGQSLDIVTLSIIFVALSCICSAMYVYNSLTDVSLDTRNYHKRHFATAVQYFGHRTTMVLFICLAVLGLTLGATLNLYVAVALMGILVTAVCYSNPWSRFKERFLLDVIFGALLPFAWRYLAAWVAITAVPVAVYPLLGLVAAKAGGYLLYKEVDRPTFIAAKIRNTVTMLPTSAVVALALTLLIASVVSFALALGAMLSPVLLLLLLLVALPPTLVAYIRATRHIDIEFIWLRRIGLMYWALVFFVVWLLLYPR